MEGRNLYEARRKMGMQLALEHPIDADLVMPVPDTGAPAAAGFAEASGLPYREGMYRNRYAGRTFIQPSAGLRHRGVTIKLNPLREVVNGKRLIVVDDSIVRGTTTKRIVELLRKAGRDRGPRPDQRPADLPPVLLRHRHADRDRADRVDPHRARDPRLHRRRFARLPLDPRRPRRARAAVRAVLLRLLRRPLSGSRAVRRGEPQVHARGGGDARMTGREGRPAGTPIDRPASMSRRATARSTSCEAHVESTHRPEVVGGLGGFGGAIAIPAGYREPLLVASTDGVGTKTAIAAPRSAASTRSGSTSSRCAPTTSCAAARSRSPSSTTSPSGTSSPSGSPSSSARSRPAAARPAARSSAARRPSTRASWTTTRSTCRAAASASSNGPT